MAHSLWNTFIQTDSTFSSLPLGSDIGPLYLLFSNSLRQVVWLQPSTGSVNVIINGLPPFNSPALFTVFPLAHCSSPIAQLATLSRVLLVAFTCDFKDIELGESKVVTRATEGKFDSAVTLTFTFGHKARESLVLHHLLCYLLPILNQKWEKGFKTDRGMGEAEGNRRLKGNCHWGHLQINKWSCNQWEKVVRIKCGVKGASEKV